jgi:hypothetical protein
MITGLPYIKIAVKIFLERVNKSCPIPMNFTTEMVQITDDLKLVDGYLACEKIMIRNIIKHLESGLDDITIENYLKELVSHLEYTLQTGKDKDVHINYQFAVGFVNTLLRIPAWKSWVKTIGV